MSTDPSKPNIMLILADNLGWGELGCYGGGILRGAATPRIDALASEGLLLHNFNVESDCVPTRSALMTGRHPIRTKCEQSVPAGQPQGLTPWELTLAEVLRGSSSSSSSSPSPSSYATAHHGKWHLGDIPGRYPSDRGFDEWYGIPRTTDETQFPTALGFSPDVAEMPYIMRGKTGEQSENVCVYDLEQRRLIDEQLVEKSKDWLTRVCSSSSGQEEEKTTTTPNQKPFFLYHPLVHLHFPTLPHPSFSGSTRHGDFADSMAELDHRVGQLLDHLSSLSSGKEPGDIARNTLVIFASDNGPEFRDPYRGTAGPWSGTYHTAMEGSLRVPCIIRWPSGRIFWPEGKGKTSNEMVHVTDLFATILSAAGIPLPSDRPIDGVDQLSLFRDPDPDSVEKGRRKVGREGFLFYIKGELRAVKWRDWKLHYVWEPSVNSDSGRGKLESPYLFNTTRDPKEETNILTFNTWVLQPIAKMKTAFARSLKNDPAPPDPLKEEGLF